ncbi:MAG: hypothetical protein ACJATG_000301, partial [Dinoroseobacter sp.]
MGKEVHHKSLINGLAGASGFIRPGGTFKAAGAL